MPTCMDHLGFKSCKADPDVWMDVTVKPNWGSVLGVYPPVGNALCGSYNPNGILENEIGKFLTMKRDSIGPPSIYLGNKESKVTLEIGTSCWDFISVQYIHTAMVELGCIDIVLEVSMMSSMMAMSRKGHLEQLYNIFEYLNLRYNSEMIFIQLYHNLKSTRSRKRDGDVLHI